MAHGLFSRRRRPSPGELARRKLEEEVGTAAGLKRRTQILVGPTERRDDPITIDYFDPTELGVAMEAHRVKQDLKRRDKLAMPTMFDKRTLGKRKRKRGGARASTIFTSGEGLGG